MHSSEFMMDGSKVDNIDGIDPVSGPLVFSCAKCRTIVGDSFSFLSSDEAAKTITISVATNIQRSTELYTSYEVVDEGSTYFRFMCFDCKHILGRFYVTTSPALDHIRGHFTFKIDSITSYELGKGKIIESSVDATPSSFMRERERETIAAAQDDILKVISVLTE